MFQSWYNPNSFAWDMVTEFGFFICSMKCVMLLIAWGRLLQE